MRIARGRHRAPDDGACVMELASMLAGERFSDRPHCVDPVLAAFLRAFNDRLPHVERQRLYPYAALAVGTRGDRAVTRARRERCLDFAGGGRMRLGLLLGLRAALRLDTGAGEWAAREVAASGDWDAGFALLDAMLDDGGVVGTLAPDAVSGTPDRRHDAELRA